MTVTVAASETVTVQDRTFCIDSPADSLSANPSAGTFNRRHYLQADREFILASLVRYVDAEVWALELGPADSRRVGFGIGEGPVTPPITED